MTTATCGDAGGRNTEGAPCGMRLGLSEVSGLCIAHDPERKEAHLEMARRGGLAPRRAKRGTVTLPYKVPKKPKSLEEAMAISAWLIEMTLGGEIDARTSEAVTKNIRQYQLLWEKKQLLDEVRQLRAELAAAKRMRAG